MATLIMLLSNKIQHSYGRDSEPELINVYDSHHALTMAMGDQLLMAPLVKENIKVSTALPQYFNVHFRRLF